MYVKCPYAKLGEICFFFFFVYRRFCPTLRKTSKNWFLQLPSCTYKHSTKWFMIIENIIIEKSTKVIITINNVKIIVTCDFSSDGLHFILYFHSWFMWRYNKTTVGNLSTENCSVDGWFGNSIHTNNRFDMFKFMCTFEEKHSIVWQKHESIWYCFYFKSTANYQTVWCVLGHIGETLIFYYCWDSGPCC
jgi:hypothetical protein